MALLFCGVFSVAHAATFGQPNATSTIFDSAQTGFIAVPNIAAPETGQVKQITFYLGSVIGQTAIAVVSAEINDQTNSTNCTTGNLSRPVATSVTQITLANSDLAGCRNYALTAGHTYNVQLNARDGGLAEVKANSLGQGPSTSDIFWQISDEPTGDGNTNTHVIRIETPALYATTTAPTSVIFDIQNSPSNLANGYVVQYTNTGNFTTTYQYGLLADSGYVSPTDDGTPFAIATTSPTLANGKYSISVTLANISPNLPYPTLTNPSGFFNPATVSYFGVGSTSFVLTPTFTSSSFSYASTSCVINFAGSFSLSDCLGYIFLPSQNWIANYTALPAQFQNIFPFSYPASIASAWSNLQASSTQNSPTFNMNFGDIGIGSTTALGNILPNAQVFGASTTQHYFPAGTFDALKALASTAIWVTFFGDVFFTVRNMITT